MRNLQDVLTNDYGLDLTGWTLEEANGISDDGRVIVGYGDNPAGQTQAWRVVIPEPSGIGLALTGGLVLLGIGQRKRLVSYTRRSAASDSRRIAAPNCGE